MYISFKNQKIAHLAHKQTFRPRYNLYVTLHGNLQFQIEELWNWCSSVYECLTPFDARNSWFHHSSKIALTWENSKYTAKKIMANFSRSCFYWLAGKCTKCNSSILVFPSINRAVGGGEGGGAEEGRWDLPSRYSVHLAGPWSPGPGGWGGCLLSAAH